MSKTVNATITDSLTQTNTQTVASTPAMAMGNLYSAIAHAMSLSSYNATSGQQNAQITVQAATVQNINSLTALGSAVLGRAAEGIVEKDA